jgi:small subunit ribosomal protein S27Ae
MGGKKHKKKVYSTPKVTPHSHKNIARASLKYYGIDNENKIIVKKNFCPSPECGSGICMAEHTDRYYCGKCNLTIFTEPKETA